MKAKRKLQPGALPRNLRREREALRRLTLVGACMSNVMFNWAQNSDRFTKDELRMMDDLRRSWDRRRGELDTERRRWPR